MPPVDVDEVIPAPTHKVSVTFERKKDLGDYNNVVARAWLEGEVAADAGPAEAADKIHELFTAVKAAVYDELGIEVLMDENGIIREKHAPLVTSTGDTTRNVADAVGVATGGVHQVRLMNKGEHDVETVPEWAVEVCAQNGITAVWANKDKNGNIYFREAVARGSQGHGDGGKAMMIFKP